MKRWLALKKIIRTAAIELMRTYKKSAQNKAVALTLGISVLRSARNGNDPLELWKRAGADPKLQEAFDEDMCAESTVFERAQQHVRTCFAAQPLIHPLSPKKPNFLKSAKDTLPKGKRNLTHINIQDGSCVRDAKGMAIALKEFWEPVWNTPNPDKDLINDYLANYEKKVDHDEILPMTLELVLETITKSRDSSTGPDGIPFAIYRLLSDTVAPLLHLLILHLSSTKKANRSFNYANLFFFPKDSSNTLPKLRPISVGNTDNRLIANVLRRCISPALCAILTDTQKAFVPGATIDDNILHFNDNFYGNLREGKDYHILLHDYQKAYDSVSRDYLFALLERIGLPQWVVNILHVRFTNNKAFPILKTTHGVKLGMGNGLKQGCPLSPLLFNLALDPLLARLRKAALSDERAYCDDLALGSSQLDSIAQTLPLIDAFNEVSGGVSNLNKIYTRYSNLRKFELKKIASLFNQTWVNPVQRVKRTQTPLRRCSRMAPASWWGKLFPGWTGRTHGRRGVM